MKTVITRSVSDEVISKTRLLHYIRNDRYGMDKKFSELRVNDFAGKIIPSNIYYYEEIASTNDVAIKLAKKANDGALILADSQKKGRGRFGRSWVSTPCQNILASLILKPSMNQKHTPKITIMISLGVARGIEKVTALKPKIKWPNDILLSNKKFCGILTEVKAAELDCPRMEYPAGHLQKTGGGGVSVIVGIGINVNMDKNDFHFELYDKATSLKIELKKEIDRFSVLYSVLKEIDKLYSDFKQDGFEKIISKWKSYAEPFFGHRVRVSLMSERNWTVPISLEGIVLDIDKDGNLILRDDEGIIHHLSGGETTIL